LLYSPERKRNKDKLQGSHRENFERIGKKYYELDEEEEDEREAKKRRQKRIKQEQKANDDDPGDWED
jgi:hypothetical protein